MVIQSPIALLLLIRRECSDNAQADAQDVLGVRVSRVSRLTQRSRGGDGSMCGAPLLTGRSQRLQDRLPVDLARPGLRQLPEKLDLAWILVRHQLALDVVL